jgi:putative heme-binding domain-containing protein
MGLFAALRSLPRMDAHASVLTATRDLGSASAPLTKKILMTLATGTGANQADVVFADTRTLAASAPTDAPRGNAQNGETIYRASCASCHRVKVEGGRLGPDLSRVGSARSRETLVKRIRGGIEGMGAGFEPVTLTPTDGPPISGVKKNEDLFSVQIMDSRERIQGYEKDKMKSVENGKRSAMPAFPSSRLSDSDLDDVVRYLQTLRGFDPSVQP